jgi:putative hydrolase of the HAD superfamily
LRKKGFKCFIATNQEKHRTNYIKEDMGFSALFDGVISSSDLGYKKPSIEFYRQLTQKIGITELKNTWFFDDTEANVISAKKFGLQARLYTGLAEFEGFAKKQNWV